jgi:hypothetical protein
MDKDMQHEILMKIAPYVSDIEFLRELLNNSENIEDLKNKLNNLIEIEEDIIKKTDIRIILEKI